MTGRQLAFVVGAPRSGTTWIQRLLAAHPHVRTGQESKLFRSYVSPLLAAWRWEAQREQDARTATGRGGTGLSCYFTDAEFLAALQDWTERLLEPMTRGLAPGEWFLEKTPAHALCLPEIRLLLPDARIIHVVRDGRDVTASLLAAGRSWGAGWAPRGAAAAAATWVRFVHAARDGAAGLAPSHFREIRFEQLSADPAGTLRDVLAFLDLAWSEAEIAAAVRMNAAGEVRSGRGTPILLGGRLAAMGRVNDPPDFVRRGAAGGWRQDLGPFEKLAVWRAAGDLLYELGYAWPIFDWIPRRSHLRRPLEAPTRSRGDSADDPVRSAAERLPAG